jgi:hypothetical protein
MNTREIINHNKEGTLAATELTFLENGNPLKALYARLMAIYLKQGTKFDRLYLQVQGDSLSIAMHGINGNILFMKLQDFFLNEKNRRVKKEFPVGGDFLLEAVSDHDKLSTIVNHTIGSTNSQDNPHYMMAVSSRRTRSYNHTILTGNQTEAYRADDLTINIGISSLSLPLIWSPIKGSLGNLKGLVTRSRNTEASANQSNLVTVASRYIQAQKCLDLPPIIHMELQPRNAARYINANTLQVKAVNVLCSLNESIVKDALPNDLDIGNIAFLYKLPRGTISSIIGKGNKKRPFGNLRICYDTTDSELKVTCRVVNEIVSEGEVKETTVETALLKDKGELVYNDTDHKVTGVVSITYATWFDLIQTARSGTSSFANFSQYMIANGQSEPVTELFGVSKNGDLVYGLQGEHSGNITFVTVSILGKHTAFDAEMLKPIETVVKTRTTKKIVKKSYDDKYLQIVDELSNKPRLLKRLGILYHTLDASKLYKKWKAISDAQCEKDSRPKEYELTEVFYLYLNSEETVTTEDIEEFNRLKK